MLKHLTISHYALIEHLDTDWHNGFSVITGETGAGKSIMLGALNLLLGGRADAKAIQAGERKCMVEAAFSIDGEKLKPFFSENDIDFDTETCIIRREVLETGKSRAFINDTPVPAAKLKEIGASLIDIHSQHQNLLIRNEHFLIDTLDVMAANHDILTKYRDLFTRHRHAADTLAQMRERASKALSEQEYLQFQLTRLEEAKLVPGEQGELEQEQNLLGHAEEIKQAFYQAGGLIESDALSISHNLRQAADALRGIAGNYANAGTLAERIDSARIELDDIGSEISTQAEQIEYDPSRLQYVQERLDTLYRLEQKHKAGSVEELLKIEEDLRGQLESVENLDEETRKQAEEEEKLKAQRDKLAAELTQMREKATHAMEKELTETLQTLGMPHVSVTIEISSRKEPDATGADHVTFLFSANKNVPAKNICETASGGEIARLMLALKSIIARRALLPTIVFDEIDTGVSGAMAGRMAEAMRQIATSCQVICITHLPQIAAMGENHYKVYKEDDSDTTRSHIVPLSPAERVEEIAHMLSGAQITEAAVNNAKSLLNGNC